MNTPKDTEISKDECCIKNCPYRGKYHNHEADGFSPHSPSWMEEERGDFKTFSLVMAYKSTKGELKYKNVEKVIADYWLSRMAQRIEEARKEGFKSMTDILTSYEEIKEEGRHEERQRFRKIIEKIRAKYHNNEDMYYDIIKLQLILEDKDE